jgi:5-formyltetrahydrofolate cyclo-ligase
MSVSDQKASLRAKLLEKRISISHKDWTYRSRNIVEKLFGLDEFRSANVVHTYVSMNDRKEVDTHTMIKELLDSEREVIVPITDFKTGELDHASLKSFDELKSNKWGVLEPNEPTTNNKAIDLILVPLLAADKKFNRLGYGKGFYDRFLGSNNFLKVGLLFDEFILDEIPVEDFDEKLDILITEKRILQRNNR